MTKYSENLAVADVEAITPAPQPEGEPVTLTYTNWRGETAQRTIMPKRIWWGATDWHPKPQWLLTAFDAEKQADRDFALRDFGTATPQPAGEAEAVACLHGYCDAENCPACSQDQEVAQPTEDELDEAWKSGFNAGFGEAKLTAHQPQPSEMIAAVERAFDEIRELNMSGRDENGHRWANSDLIDQTVTEGLVALRALKGDDANG